MRTRTDIRDSFRDAAKSDRRIDSMSTEGKKPTEASFLQFVSGMAVQTLVHLGKMSNPLTGGAAVDLPNAKYSIDILAILEEKTKGNLSPQEAEYLQNALRDLRLEYVSVAGGGEKKDARADASRTGENPGE